MTKFILIRGQLLGLSKLIFVVIATILSRQQKVLKSSVAHCTHKPNLSFVTITILELFTIMISEWRLYTPEPRSQTTNRETWIRTIICFESFERELKTMLRLQIILLAPTFCVLLLGFVIISVNVKVNGAIPG